MPPSRQIFIPGASTHKCQQVCQIWTSYSSTSFRDKEGVLKFNVGAITPLPYPVRWNFCVCSRYLARSNSVPNFSIVSMHHAVMRICIFHRLTIICAQKWGFGGGWGWRCEDIVFWPPKGTRVNTHASVDVSHVKIGSTAWALGPWKNFAYKEEIFKNWVVTLAIWGEVTPGATLTICGVWGRDMVDVIYLVIYLVWPHQSCWSTSAAIGLVGHQSSKKPIRDCFSRCRPFLKLFTVLAFTVWWSK